VRHLSAARASFDGASLVVTASTNGAAVVLPGHDDAELAAESADLLATGTAPITDVTNRTPPSVACVN
jgi:hypothetical protein